MIRTIFAYCAPLSGSPFGIGISGRCGAGGAVVGGTLGGGVVGGIGCGVGCGGRNGPGAAPGGVGAAAHGDVTHVAACPVPVTTVPEGVR
jgi:hypothetical protein